MVWQEFACYVAHGARALHVCSNTVHCSKSKKHVCRDVQSKVQSGVRTVYCSRVCVLPRHCLCLCGHHMCATAVSRLSARLTVWSDTNCVIGRVTASAVLVVAYKSNRISVVCFAIVHSYRFPAVVAAAVAAVVSGVRH